MGNTNVTTPHVWPSQNDLNGGVSNDGKRMLEKYARELWQALNGISYVVSGGALPASAANLVLIVPAGVAVISGLLVKWGQTNVTLPASQTSHIFVKLTFSGSLVTGIQIEDNITGTHPADAIKLGLAVTSGSAMTSTTDQRLLDGNQRLRRALITATGATSWIVPANVTRIRIRQWGAGGGGGGGGGGPLGTYSGGDGGTGSAGAYVESVFTVTPGATVTVTNGTGGTGGGGGAGSGGGGADGSNGSVGASSSIVATGINFTAGGGGPGLGGKGAASGGPSRDPTPYYHDIGQASASSGTADNLCHGGGRAGGTRGTGQQNNGTAGSAGQNAVTIIDY